MTYESAVVNNAKIISDQFLDELCVELNKFRRAFKEKLTQNRVQVHLVLLPLKSKEALVRTLDAKLKALQS